MNVLIVFDTKHGNTKQVAELIAEGINSVEGNETIVANVKGFDINEDKTYELIVIEPSNSELSEYTKYIKKIGF
jgi:flavodoxin